MRTFSEYYNLYITKKEKSDDVIVENVKSRSVRYKMMFSKFLSQNKEFEKNIDKIIFEAVTKLKKDNVIIYVLKRFRNFISKIENKNDPAMLTIAVINVRRIIDIFEHYMSLPIPEIQNYNYSQASDKNVLDEFKRFEDEWQKSRVGWIDITDELKEETITPIIKYPNGFAWFDLSKPYCNEEGNAMGHCGNTASYRNDDTVLSYRLVKKQGDKIMSRPSLTFILNGDGYLGEMKGRANEKPKEKYHAAIVDLLLSKVKISTRNNDTQYRIKGLRGGGYEPENNFEITDLKDSTLKNKLFSKRPELEPLSMRIAGGFNPPNEFIISELSNVLQVPQDNIIIPIRYNDMMRDYTKYAHVYGWSDWSELLNDIDPPKNLKYFMDIIENGYFEGGNIRTISETEVIDFLEDIMNENSVIKSRILKAVNSWIEQYPDMRDEGVNIDPSTVEGIYNLLEINDRDTIDLVKRCINDAEEAGAFNAMSEAFKNGIKNLEFISDDGIKFGVEFANENNWMESSISLVLSLGDTLKIIDGKINPFDSYSLEDGDMQVPYYGFDGYDDTYAKDLFASELNI
jgi:hypothetical protein